MGAANESQSLNGFFRAIRGVLQVMADFDSVGMKGELCAELEEVVALQQQGGAQLLDVRSRQQFLGEVPPTAAPHPL